MRKSIVKRLSVYSRPTFSDTEEAIMVVKIDHEEHTISCAKTAGGDPSWEEFLDAMLGDKDFFQEILWSLQYRRSLAYGVQERVGMSGRRDLTLWVAKPGVPLWAAEYGGREVALRVFISCFGKFDGTLREVFFPDLLELFAHDLPDIMQMTSADLRKLHRKVRRTMTEYRGRPTKVSMGYQTPPERRRWVLTHPDERHRED